MDFSGYEPYRLSGSVLLYLHDGLLVGKQVTKQGDVGLTKGRLVGDAAALGAHFGQHHCLGEFARLLQVIHPHLQEGLTLQADERINWEREFEDSVVNALPGQE